MARVPPSVVLQKQGESDVSAKQSVWNSTADPKTVEVTVEDDDIIVVGIAIENANGDPDWTVSGGGLTWAKIQDHPNASNNNVAGEQAWWAAATEAGTVTITADKTSGNTGRNWGFVAQVWRDSEGIGGSTKGNNGTSSGAPNVSYSTTKDASALFALIGDWNATTTGATWRTSAGAATHIVTAQVTGVYSAYSAHHANAGSTGSKEVGMTAPSGQRWGMVVVEILGVEEAEEPVDLAADLAGAGTATVTLRPTVPLAAGLSGSGAASAELRALVSLSTSIGGQGALSADLVRLAVLAADLGGTGAVSAEVTTPGGAPEIDLPTRAVVEPISLSAVVAALSLAGDVAQHAATAEIVEHAATATVAEAHTVAEVEPHVVDAEVEPHEVSASVEN